MVLALLAASWLTVDIASPLRLTPAEKVGIRRAIGKSRVVMLGELTHGDGTSFEMKSTLVEFLHKEAGFDILIWESGLYDCAEMDPLIGGTAELGQVASVGVFPHWSQSPESLRTFEYARTTYKTKRPLLMAGFDLQSSGRGSDSQFPDMYSWFGKHESLSTADRLAIEGAFEAVRTAKSGTAFQEAYQKTMATSALLWKAYSDNRGYWQKTWGKDAEFRSRILWNADRYREMLTLAPKNFMESYNLRERVNADNLLWLVRTKFKDKKVIVWAHNMHIFKGVPAISIGAKAGPGQGQMESMGRMVANALGSDVYSIGFLANEGEWAWLGNGPIKFGPRNPNSWERNLKQSLSPIVFADLRTANEGSVEATIDQQNPLTMKGDWRRGFDAFIYIDKMKARTQIKP